MPYTISCRYSQRAFLYAVQSADLPARRAGGEHRVEGDTEPPTQPGAERGAYTTAMDPARVMVLHVRSEPPGALG
jgi:hypothetical protein